MPFRVENWNYSAYYLQKYGGRKVSMCTAGFHRSLLKLLGDNVFSCVGVRIYCVDGTSVVMTGTGFVVELLLRRERRESAFTNSA